MVEQGGEQDGDDDRRRSAKARRQDESQQLRLVTDLRQRDDAGGYEEYLQASAPFERRPMLVDRGNAAPLPRTWSVRIVATCRAIS
jgi:hypothetical protein